MSDDLLPYRVQLYRLLDDPNLQMLSSKVREGASLVGACASAGVGWKEDERGTKTTRDLLD